MTEADRLWLVGEQASRDGLHALSARMLERLIERHPSDGRVPEANLLLGKTRLAQGTLPGALEAFRRAQEASPPPGKPEEARFWEAETLFRMKRYSEARAVYDKVVAENAASPFAPDALYGLGWSQVEMKQREAAVSTFRQLIRAFPDHETMPSAAVQAARLLTEMKSYDEAAAVLKPVVERRRDHRLAPEARYMLGLAHLSAGKTTEGIADLRALVAAHPTHDMAGQARRLIVDTLLKQGKKDDLAREYKTLMAQSPLTAEGLYDAGLLASRLGRPKDAEQAWTDLRSDFPDSPLAARASLDLAQAAFKRGAFKDAATLGRTATKSSEAPVRAQAYLLTGESELKLKRWEPAHQAFRAAVDTAGGDADVKFRALAGSGLTMEELKQWAQAARYYDEVASGSPDKELRAWAKGRNQAVAAQLKPAPKPGTSSSAAKPAPKPGASGSATKPTPKASEPAPKAAKP